MRGATKLESKESRYANRAMVFAVLAMAFAEPIVEFLLR